MARIPTDELERIKQGTDLVALIEQKGIKLEKRGRDLAGRCCFHEDDTASLIVTPEKGLWHCFGCGAAGDVVAWVMKTEGVSFRHAVELLKKRAQLSPGVTKTSTVRKLESLIAVDAEDQQLLDDVARYYHETLLESPEAQRYLEERGIYSMAVVEKFRLGFANRTLGLRLPMRNRVDGEKIRGRLTKLGIIRESGHEHLAGSLVIPILDERGRVQGMYGRKVTSHLRPGTALHLYLPGPHKGVFNVEALASSTEIILCEALIDALTFWHHGYVNVTSSFGVEGFTDEMLATMTQYGTKRVLIAYDRDDAGDAAAAKLAAKLAATGLESARIHLPKGMDVNEYALKVTPADKSLALVVAQVSKGQAAKEMEREEAAPVTEPPPPPLAAAVALKNDLVVERSGDELAVTIGDRQYRVRGLALNTSSAILKVNLLVRRGEASHIDTVDLYQAKQRATFMLHAAHELGVKDAAVKADLAELLVLLERAQREALEALTKPAAAAPPMSEAERSAALALLRAKDLALEVVRDFERCGIVGEQTNKLVAYLAMTSRKLAQPLAVIVQSSSAAGKSSLMEAALAFCPEEEKQKFSSMTQQSLYYMRRDALKHKVLAVAEEEGVRNASYPLKVMNSEGELSIAAPSKNPASGLIETTQYKVDGPVMLFMTTTSVDVDEELMNRCLVLSVDEDRAQTRAIQDAQRRRRTLEGLKLRSERDSIVKLHQNAQRLLRPLHVVNPWANDLTFSDDKTRMRRDNAKYLTVIEAVALLYQHQRPVRTVEHAGQTLEYIEVTLDDIALANRLCAEILGRSLDELPSQTRKMLTILSLLVDEQAVKDGVERGDVRLTRRSIFQATGWSSTVARRHIDRLVDVELLVPHRGKNGVAFVYQLAFDENAAAGAIFSGLIDVERLRAASTTLTLLTQEPELAQTLPPPCSDLAPTLLPPIVDEKSRISPKVHKSGAASAVVPYAYANGRGHS